MAKPVRVPDKITHVYELTNDELHDAIRAYLGIPQEQVTSIEWSCYGSTADAEVSVYVGGRNRS